MNELLPASITFSIIIPLLAHEDHITQVVAEHQEGLKQLGDSFELIVVVNGDKDLPAEASQRIVSEEPLVTEIRLKKAGWGRSIKAGLSIARGHFICYTNASHAEVGELVKVLRYARVSDRAVVKGMRLMRENKKRQWVSFIFNFENRLLFKTPVLDVNCSPKVIPKKIIDKLSLFTDYNLFDAELMYRCYRHSVPIIEIPLKWGKRISGKSSTNLATHLELSLGLIWLRWKLRQ